MRKIYFGLALAFIAGPAHANPPVSLQRQGGGGAVASEGEVVTEKIPYFFMLPKNIMAVEDGLPADKALTESFTGSGYKTRILTHKNEPKVALRIFKFSAESYGKPMAEALTKSGALRTGDIILTFRPSWGPTLAYNRVQMGVSHTGGVFIADNGIAHTIESPLSYSSHFTASHHYNTGKDGARSLHILRPDLSPTQMSNLNKWAKLMLRHQGGKLDFNADYSAPKWVKRGDTYRFVDDIGKIAKGNPDAKSTNTYCSEFIFAWLGLRDCDPDQTNPRELDYFDKSNEARNACVYQGTDPDQRRNKAPQFAIGGVSNPGLMEGPSMVLKTIGYTDADRQRKLAAEVITNGNGQAITEPGSRLRKPDLMSQGHFDVAKLYAPLMLETATYFKTGETDGEKRTFLNNTITQNYSPTSFLIRAAMPDSENPAQKVRIRYLGTMTIEDI